MRTAKFGHYSSVLQLAVLRFPKDAGEAIEEAGLRVLLQEAPAICDTQPAPAGSATGLVGAQRWQKEELQQEDILIVERDVKTPERQLIF